MNFLEKYSEDELKTIIKLYYTERDYFVDDLHEADRRGEKGADLIVYRRGEAEKIAIAIKVKPKKSDIYQLQELAKRSERYKKYIYIQTPSTDFYFKMEQYKDKVDFWDSRKLTYEISNSNPRLTVWLIASNHPLYNCIGQINYSLATLWLNCNEKKELPGKSIPDATFYRDIWRLKDDFSSLNKSLQLMQTIFEYDPPEAENFPNNPLNLSILFEKLLTSLLTPTLEDSNRRLLNIISKHGNLISAVVEQTGDRSNWLYYSNFDWSLMPGNIRSDLISEVEDNFFEPMNMMTSIEKLTYEIRQYQGVFFEIGDFARILYTAAYFIECFIDDVFTYSINTSFKEKPASELNLKT